MRWLARRVAASGPDDEGSVLILTLGYAVLALAAVFVCVDATSLYLAQTRLDGLADAAALAGADGFTLEVIDGEPHAELTSEAVHAQADALVAEVGGGARARGCAHTGRRLSAGHRRGDVASGGLQPCSSRMVSPSGRRRQAGLPCADVSGDAGHTAARTPRTPPRRRGPALR